MKKLSFDTIFLILFFTAIACLSIGVSLGVTQRKASDKMTKQDRFIVEMASPAPNKAARIILLP